MTRKQWNRKTTNLANISVIDVVTKQIVLLCVDLKEKNKKQMCDQIKKVSIQSSEKIKMQEYIEFRKKKARYPAISN